MGTHVDARCPRKRIPAKVCRYTRLQVYALGVDMPKHCQACKQGGTNRQGIYAWKGELFPLIRTERELRANCPRCRKNHTGGRWVRDWFVCALRPACDAGLLVRLSLPFHVKHVRCQRLTANFVVVCIAVQQSSNLRSAFSACPPPSTRQ